MHVMYLHGFRSSPDSRKGKILRQVFSSRFDFSAPDLNVGPKQAQEIMMQATRGIDPKQLCLVGSSLGGFYATWLAETLNCRAVLLNPATQPWNVINDYLGVQTIYNSTRTIEVKPEFADQARELDVAVTNPSRYLVFLSTADEVLDWHLGQMKYAACREVILPGNIHEIERFEECVSAIEKFLGV